MTAPPRLSFAVRPVDLDRDLPGLLAVERSAFAQPWDRSDFRAWLRDPRYRGLVAFAGGSLHAAVGFAICGDLGQDGVEVSKVAVDSFYRRMGVGRALIAQVARAAATSAGGRLLHTTVRDDDLVAQLFFRSCGFKAVKVLRRVMPDKGDAWRFVRGA